MTTVGVAASKPPRVDALRFPSYTYHYPATQQAQLWKHCHDVSRPATPVFRQTDAQKKRIKCLLDRSVFSTDATNITLSHNEDKNVKASKRQLRPISKQPIPAPPKPDLIARARLPPSEHSKWRYDIIPRVTTPARGHWNHFLSRTPERFEIQLPLQEHDCQVYSDGGYALRFLRPFSTRGVGLETGQTRMFGVKPVAALPSPFRSARQYYDVSTSATNSRSLTSGGCPY